VLLGRLRIRGKLALLAAIPLLAVAGLTVPLVVNQVQLADRAEDTARSVRIAGGIGSLVQDLQQERLLSAGYLVQVAEETALVEQTARVTDRITDVRADLGDELPTEVSAAVEGVRDLGPVRTQVLARTLGPERAVAAFNTVITRLIKSLHLGERVDLSGPGGRNVAALDVVLRLDEGINTGAAYMIIAAATRSQTSIALLGATLATLQAITDRVQTYTTPEQFALYNLVQDAFQVRAGRDFITGYALNPVGTLATLSAPTLFPSMLSFITLGRFVERKIATEVTAEVNSQQRRALAFAYVTGVLSILVLLLVLVLSVAVAGAVARPLTRLTRSADRVARVAEEELERVVDDESEAASPVHLAPVEVRAQDEIGDLARAFERVQRTAARLVERQVASRRNVAQMFGHVGRRTQNLVGRQIALIDQLERDEQDPSRLQYLYRLDHVSSRLRRNAGSLVVLSGATGGQPHVSPMQLGDVVRLALGEIEDYTRVDISVPDDLVVSPALVGDLVLMLAELMENATTFSPPDTRVSVSAARSGTGTGARLAIVDHGLGLPPDRLAEENARLSRRERLDLAPTEVLGLFVVGRLARRHGVGVTLAPTPGGGVTAVVDLAQHMLVPVSVQPDPTAFFLLEAPAAGQTRVPAALLPADPYPTSPAGAQQTWPAWPVSRAAITGPEPVAASRPGPGVLPDLPYDAAMLDRANRTLEAGPTWNAFATGEQETQPSQAAAPTPAAPTPVASAPPASTSPASTLDEARPASTPPAETLSVSTPLGEPRLHETRPDETPDETPLHETPLHETPPDETPPDETPPPRITSAPVTPEPPAIVAHGSLSTPASATEDTVPILRRRVPGAQLPSGVSAQPVGPAPLPGDPESARALIEEFEAGVRRALNEAADRSTVDQPTGPAGSQALTRRVPGATLHSPPGQSGRPPAAQPPPDPEQARRLVEEFESGVARALREVGSDHRYEQEEPQ
jgi:HAMP domain-containing protein